MPRIMVVADDKQTLMDEHVIPDHLNDEHSAVQLLERLAWAIEDAHKRTGSQPRRKSRRRLIGGPTHYTRIERS